MISTSDLKRGARLTLDGEPYTVLDVTTQTPSARGANTLVKMKARNILTGQLVSKTFKSGEKFEVPDMDTRPSQFLYADGDTFVFMDNESYEQYEMRREAVGDAVLYLLEGLAVRVLLLESRPVAIDLPNTVELLVVETEPAVRGDTVSAQTKGATLETGLVVQVPMFLERDERIKVDTRDGRYLERVRD